MIAVCALAGLWLGEAAAPQFGDVDYAHRKLHVRRQVQPAGRKNVEVRLPRYGSEHTVPMPDELAAILERREELVHLSEWLFAGGEPDPLTRTPLATSGVRPSNGRGWTPSDCTTCGTSTPRA